MGTMDRYSRDEVQRILKVSAKQLNQWDRLHLVSMQEEQGKRYYDFSDLIGLRTVKKINGAGNSGAPAGPCRGRAARRAFAREHAAE